MFKILSVFGVVLVAASFTICAHAVLAQQQGYLLDDSFDVRAVLPPAPQPGDARYEADREIFKVTRKLVGTPRYMLATSDVKTDPVSLMKDFSCAVGVTLTPDELPKTMALIRRASHDTQVQTNLAKNTYKRQRPFLIDDGEVCESKITLAMSYDYPSGHTTAGWTWAMILAELVPERATAILMRGRAYGESRFICGAHNESAVEAGRLSATATLTAMHGLVAYQEDEAAARHEMEELIAAPKLPPPQQCQDELALLSQKVL